jgi:hypothetical protein
MPTRNDALVPTPQKKGRGTKEPALFDAWFLESLNAVMSSLLTGVRCVRFELPTEVVMKRSIFWDLTSVRFKQTTRHCIE